MQDAIWIGLALLGLGIGLWFFQRLIRSAQSVEPIQRGKDSSEPEGYYCDAYPE